MTTQHAAPEPVIGEGYQAAPSRPMVGAGPVRHPGPLPGPTLPTTARRLAVGYMRLSPGTNTLDSDQVTARMRAFAARSGLDLVNTFADHYVYRSAFGELLQALCDPDITAVIIPTPEHLSEFDGIYKAMRALIELETGADVLVMSQTTEATP